MIVLGALAIAAWVASGRRVEFRKPGRRRGQGPADVLLVARLLSVGLAAGRPLRSVVEEILPRLDPRERAPVEDLMGRARSVGMARALVETTGPLGPLAERLAKAQVTGAPMVAAIDAYATSVHDLRRARAVEEARVIGVKLIVPVALLLLPGFIALIVGPFVLDQVKDLVGTTVP